MSACSSYQIWGCVLCDCLNWRLTFSYSIFTLLQRKKHADQHHNLQFIKVFIRTNSASQIKSDFYFIMWLLRVFFLRWTGFFISIMTNLVIFQHYNLLLFIVGYFSLKSHFWDRQRSNTKSHICLSCTKKFFLSVLGRKGPLWTAKLEVTPSEWW